MIGSTDSIEILVAIDPDNDQNAHQVGGSLVLPETDTDILCAVTMPTRTMGFRPPQHLEVWVAPERYGYARLNEYFNHLASIARGDWLMLWNDDARMLTEGWNQEIEATTLRSDRRIMVCDLWVDRHSPDLCTFPVVRREAVEAIGGVFSPVTCHCDTWWQDIGRQTQSIAPVRVKVDHQRADLTGQHRDRTYLEGQAGYRQHEFYGPAVQGAIHSAATRLRRYLSAAAS